VVRLDQFGAQADDLRVELLVRRLQARRDLVERGEEFAEFAGRHG
jgi:hypothetical protein